MGRKLNNLRRQRVEFAEYCIEQKIEPRQLDKLQQLFKRRKELAKKQDPTTPEKRRKFYCEKEIDEITHQMGYSVQGYDHNLEPIIIDAKNRPVYIPLY